MDITFDELYKAYLTCKVRKRRTANAIRFELNLEENLFELYDDLVNNNYKIGRFIYFILTKPKYREVWASDFRDRIVHHLIYNRMIGYYYPRFIHDTYACIPGRGTDAAFFRMVKFIRSESQSYQYKTYALKLDIKNFFINIDRVILWDLIKNNETIEDINSLVKQVVFHNPIDNYYFKGDKNLQQFVPHHKRLFNAKINCGLPIGNLTSQFFANIYLNQLDQYCKRVLKIKKYIRYVDDIVIISRDKKLLLFYYEKMQDFIVYNLNLTFHQNKIQIIDISNGVDFVGKIAFPYYNKIRDSTLNNMYYSFENINDYKKLIQTTNSYLGMLRQVNSYNIRKRFLEKNKYLYYDIHYEKLIAYL